MSARKKDAVDVLVSKLKIPRQEAYILWENMNAEQEVDA